MCVEKDSMVRHGIIDRPTRTGTELVQTITRIRTKHVYVEYYVISRTTAIVITTIATGYIGIIIIC